jgi:hypothetical protein
MAAAAAVGPFSSTQVLHLKPAVRADTGMCLGVELQKGISDHGDVNMPPSSTVVTKSLFLAQHRALCLSGSCQSRLEGLLSESERMAAAYTHASRFARPVKT